MSGLLSHLVRRTLAPETAVSPLRQLRFVPRVGKAPPSVEADRRVEDAPADPAGSVGVTRHRSEPLRSEPLAHDAAEASANALRARAEKPVLRPAPDAPKAAGPARPQPHSESSRRPVFAAREAAKSPPAVSGALPRNAPHEPAEEPPIRWARHSPRRTRQSVEMADPAPANPPSGVDTRRHALPTPRQARARALPAPDAQHVATAPPRQQQQQQEQEQRRPTAVTKSEPASDRAPPRQPAEPAAPSPAKPSAAPRPVFARGLPAAGPQSQRPPGVAAREPKPSAPDVHISIGRVEIRAVAPTEIPERRAKAPSAPVESLVDYLARRDGGRR